MKKHFQAGTRTTKAPTKNTASCVLDEVLLVIQVKIGENFVAVRNYRFEKQMLI
jgi:hypothetical protein